MKLSLTVTLPVSIFSVRRCGFNPVKPILNAPEIERLEQTFDETALNFACEFNLRPYVTVDSKFQEDFITMIAAAALTTLGNYDNNFTNVAITADMIRIDNIAADGDNPTGSAIFTIMITPPYGRGLTLAHFPDQVEEDFVMKRCKCLKPCSSSTPSSSSSSSSSSS